MKDNLTSINVIIDKSGSMNPLAKDTIGGFNKFLADQKLVEGDVMFTLVTFNNRVSTLHDFVKLASVKDLDSTSYVPSGNTALLDALGSTINSVGAKLASLQEADRPSKVLFLVMTDGEENSSSEFTKDKIKEMVTHQINEYNWEFVFIGANMDAFSEAKSLGFSEKNAYNYNADTLGTENLFRSISAGSSRFRSAVRGDKSEESFLDADEADSLIETK